MKLLNICGLALVGALCACSGSPGEVGGEPVGTAVEGMFPTVQLTMVIDAQNQKSVPPVIVSRIGSQPFKRGGSNPIVPMGNGITPVPLHRPFLIGPSTEGSGNSMIAPLTFDPAEMDRWHQAFVNSVPVTIVMLVDQGGFTTSEELDIALDCLEI